MGRVALVTGGTRGIGAAISKALQDAGYSVAASYAGNDEAAAKFTADTGIKTYKWNVADYDESKAGIEQVEAEVGPIDIVVANAGITRDAPFHKMTPEQWQEVIDTNLTGVFNTVHPIWPGMRERKFGRVIVISSINGQKGINNNISVDGADFNNPFFGEQRGGQRLHRDLGAGAGIEQAFGGRLDGRAGRAGANDLGGLEPELLRRRFDGVM